MSPRDPARGRARRLAPALAAILMLGLVSAPSGASAVAAPHVRQVTFAGDGVSVRIGQLHKLNRTGPDFRAFVGKRLDRLWRYLDKSPSCKSAPLVVVKRWRSDGFAQVTDEGTFAPCPSGGAESIYARTHGRWHVVLTSQDGYTCSDLHRFGVPVSIAPRHCWSDLGKSLSYRTSPWHPKTFFTPRHAASTLLESVRRLQPAASDHVASSRVTTLLYSERSHGVRFELLRCLRATDPKWGRFVGTAARGCLVRSTYPIHQGESEGVQVLRLLRMYGGPHTPWRARSIVTVWTNALGD